MQLLKKELGINTYIDSDSVEEQLSQLCLQMVFEMFEESVEGDMLEPTSCSVSACSASVVSKHVLCFLFVWAR